MYTPPVTPWELVMPEVSDPTPSEHDRVITERSSVISAKKENGPMQVVLSRGRELPKAGPVTGVKS